MSKLLHGFLHVLAVGVQLANVYSGVVPAKYQPLVAAATALAQAALALYNHTKPALAA